MQNLKALAARAERPVIVLSLTVLGSLWLAFLLWGRNLPASRWAALFPDFNQTEASAGSSSANHILVVVGIWLTLLTFMPVALWLLYRFRGQWSSQRVPSLLFSAAACLGAVYLLFLNQYSCAVEAGWYNLSAIMTDPASVPIWGHRILLVLPAMWIKALRPGISYYSAFYVVQIATMLVAMYLIGVWSATFVGKERSFLGQILLVLLMAPTFHYWNFPDIGVVLFHTLCFFFLYRRNYGFFVASFCLGTLNHENIVLLIPVAAAIMWGRERVSLIVKVTVTALVGYIAIRLALGMLLPTQQVFGWRVWANMRSVAELQKGLLMGQLTVLPWFICAAAVLRYADPFLQRAALLLPLQYGVFFLFGQLNEARLFNGFLPILIGILLCYVRFLSPGAERATASGLRPKS